MVQPFDEVKWAAVRRQITTRGLLEKFRQNPHLLHGLLATGHKTLVEASASDCIWGVGLSERDDRISDKRNWRGQNLLGEILMDVRLQCKK